MSDRGHRHIGDDQPRTADVSNKLPAALAFRFRDAPQQKKKGQGEEHERVEREVADQHSREVQAVEEKDIYILYYIYHILHTIKNL